MKHLLIVYHSKTGNTQSLAEAVIRGATDAEGRLAEAEQELETLKRIVSLKDDQIVCFAHQTSGVGGKQYQAPRSLDRFRFLNTTLDSEDSYIDEARDHPRAGRD